MLYVLRMLRVSCVCPAACPACSACSACPACAALLLEGWHIGVMVSREVIENMEGHVLRVVLWVRW